MEEIKGTVNSWHGSIDSNTITLDIEESDAISLRELVGRKVVITLQ